MRVELGARVRASDGTDVGVIKHLILDPESGEIKKAVVEKGFLLTDDIEVPVQDMEVGPDNDLRLSCTPEQVQAMPRFDAGRYEAPPEEYRAAYAYPVGGMLWPASSPAPAATTGPFVYGGPVGVPTGVDRPRLGGEREEILRREDDQNAVIEKGDDIISRDGEKVGVVDDAEYDGVSGKPIRLRVRRGFLFTHDVELPGAAIASVDDGVIYLNLDRAQVEAADRGSSDRAA